jgi:hypothetical protein
MIGRGKCVCTAAAPIKKRKIPDFRRLSAPQPTHDNAASQQATGEIQHVFSHGNDDRLGSDIGPGAGHHHL